MCTLTIAIMFLRVFKNCIHLMLSASPVRKITKFPYQHLNNSIDVFHLQYSALLCFSFWFGFDFILHVCVCVFVWLYFLMHFNYLIKILIISYSCFSFLFLRKTKTQTLLFFFCVNDFLAAKKQIAEKTHILGCCTLICFWFLLAWLYAVPFLFCSEFLCLFCSCWLGRSTFGWVVS